MAKIKIMDLPRNMEIGRMDMRRMAGGGYSFSPRFSAIGKADPLYLSSLMPNEERVVYLRGLLAGCVDYVIMNAMQAQQGSGTKDTDP